jgi:phospholipid/cholesterol/gamma-HCH transport system permease protein
MSFTGKIGRPITQKLGFYAGLISLIYYSIGRLFSKPKGRYYFKDILIKQVYFTGVQATTIISIIAVAVGVVLIYQLNSFMAGLPIGGLQEQLGNILVIVVVRELGPLLTAIIIVARSGTAIATEIGSMMVDHQVEALETMGIDTLYFIVLPRILGMVISLAVLNIYFTAVCISGGFLVAFAIDPNLNLGQIIGRFFDTLSFYDILESIIKAVFFGAGISVICVINGFKALFYKGGVPVSGINAVVGSLIYVFFMNAILSLVFLL